MMLDFDLSNKNILIFGSEGLIGKKICEIIKKKNGNIIKVDIKKINSENYFLINTENFKKLLAGKKKILKKYKKIDAIINCTYPKIQIKNRDFFKQDPKKFIQETTYHITTYYNILNVFLNYFKKQGSGNIINFTSIYGQYIPRFEIYKNTKMGMPIQYLISKNAIIKMSEYLAKLCLKSKIRINCISPGGIFDNQNKKFVKKYSSFCRFNSMLSPSDLSGTIIFLLSDESKKITGQNIVIDDGFTL